MLAKIDLTRNLTLQTLKIDFFLLKGNREPPFFIKQYIVNFSAFKKQQQPVYLYSVSTLRQFDSSLGCRLSLCFTRPPLLEPQIKLPVRGRPCI